MPVEFAPKIVTDIINEELQQSEFSDIIVSNAYILTETERGLFIQADDPFKDFATEILDRVSKNRFKSSNQFYHFKTAERIIDVLRQKVLYAVNLPGHNANDNAEYRAWIIDILKREEWLLPEKNPWHEVYGQSRIEDWRGSIHILCLTKSITEWMWSNYAGTDENPATGACLVLEFQEFNDSEIELLQPLYDFRDVFYDNEEGNRFELFDRIQKRVLKATDRNIIFHNMLHFAWYYKRHDYKIEDEVRLSFDAKRATWFGKHLQNHYDLLYYNAAKPPWGHLSLPLFDSSESRDKRHPLFDIPVYLPSPHFKIVLRKVILGGNMDLIDVAEVKKWASRHYPNAVVVKEIDPLL